jgi:ribosomal protein S18 acetylase RimI-like enzyme
MDNFLIRKMCADDLAFAAECTAAEGWQSENHTTLAGFFKNDPEGCFIAEQAVYPLGICIATRYGTSGFIGELIVRPEARGGGLGAALLNHAVAYLRQNRVQTIYLDGVVKAIGLYERNGFRRVCRSWRFSGKLAGKPGAHVRLMTRHDLGQVIALDQLAFGADRSFFLRLRYDIYPELSFVMVNSQEVIGYLLGRGHAGWISAGPWVMREVAGNPAELLFAFSQQADDRPISMGILEANPLACELVRSLGFTARADSPWRMALGTRDDLGASPRCLAVGSAAKG